MTDLERLREAVSVLLEQAEGCWLNHCGDNPEGSPVPSHIALGQAALAAAPPGAERGEVEFNINDHVRVKLTDLGCKIYREYWSPFVRVLGDAEPEIDSEGWSRFQLWELAHIFGEHLSNGADVPFETTIRLPAPPSPPASEGEK